MSSNYCDYPFWTQSSPHGSLHLSLGKIHAHIRNGLIWVQNTFLDGILNWKVKKYHGLAEKNNWCNVQKSTVENWMKTTTIEKDTLSVSKFSIWYWLVQDRDIAYVPGTSQMQNTMTCNQCVCGLKYIVQSLSVYVSPCSLVFSKELYFSFISLLLQLLFALIITPSLLWVRALAPCTMQTFLASLWLWFVVY